jgi:hypothetical protein
MAQIQKPVGGRVTRVKAAFNVFAIAALSLNILATGVPALIAGYNDAQARIPQPLAAEQKPTAPPAADSPKLTQSKVVAPTIMSIRLTQ